MTLSRIKNWLASHIFKEEVRALRAEQARLLAVNAEKERRLAEVTLVDLVREQLKGFNPRLLNKEGDILEGYEDEDSEKSFLEQVKALNDNKALRPIVDYLTRNQLLFIGKEANSLHEINLGRGTINGLSLVMEEIERLYLIHQERNTGGEPFDPSAVI